MKLCIHVFPGLILTQFLEFITPYISVWPGSVIVVRKCVLSLAYLTASPLPLIVSLVIICTMSSQANLLNNLTFTV